MDPPLRIASVAVGDLNLATHLAHVVKRLGESVVTSVALETRAMVGQGFFHSIFDATKNLVLRLKY